MHVMELYPAITETIPNDALSFAKQHEEISDDLQINNPNLGGGNLTPPYWFSFNNSKTVKAVSLAFCNIQ